LNGSPREGGGTSYCYNNHFETVPNCDTIINGEFFW